MAAATSLRSLLEDHTLPADASLVRQESGGGLRCLACGHRCLIKPGRAGICRVRFNRDGQLRVPGGYAAGVQVDPIEKKPFYHAFPGRDALSFGMMGCDLHCGYCQNWVTSQALRDDQAVIMPRFCSAEKIVDSAIQRDVPVVVSTYNEPLITSEWAVEVFKVARNHGLTCGYVSNGNGTPEVVEFLRPYVDLYKVDLKSFDDKHYRELGGVLANVLRTIEQLIAAGFWVEIVTLIIPGFNDSDKELTSIAAFIAGVDLNIPWHITAFHPDYKMRDAQRTPARTLIRAYDIGRDAGLRYVYPGNLPGGVGDRENTCCPACGTLIIQRQGFYVRQNLMKVAGRCPECEAQIAGVWEEHAPTCSNGTGIPMPILFS